MLTNPLTRTHSLVYTAILMAAFGSTGFAAGSNVYIQHNLVADRPGVADVTDPNLVNPWGMAESATSPFWISDEATGVSTLYNGSGTIVSLVAKVPLASGASGGTPTGQVNNTNTTVFLLPTGKAASFIFATQDGTISGWAGGIPGNVAAIMVNNSASGAVYKGLAIGANGSGPLLYAANFNSGAIDVFDAKFNSTKVAGGFADPDLPPGMAPFNIWALNGKLYVAYAVQDGAKRADVAGPGNGIVNVFDFDGNLVQHLITKGGALNSPWGLAIAPSTFGAFAGNLLVGNFGDGKVNAFDTGTGALVGTLQNANGAPIVIPGLWALLFGNGVSGGDKNTLYFTAGPNNQQDGLFGSLAPPATILSVMNAASYAAGSVAPGEAVVLSGLTLGPSPLAVATIPAIGQGRVSTTLGGTAVTFNGTPASILYTSASQLSVLVPYEIAGSSTATISVTYRGQTASTQVPVVATLPGVFTLNFSGTGQAVALNIDDSINGASNPASAGSVITLFATGEGMTNPPGEDGTVNDRIIREPQAGVSLNIGGMPATVIYAGTATGLVQGILQVEALIPAGLTGTAPVVLTVGTASSQSGVTISLK